MSCSSGSIVLQFSLYSIMLRVNLEVFIHLVFGSNPIRSVLFEKIIQVNDAKWLKRVEVA